MVTITVNSSVSPTPDKAYEWWEICDQYLEGTKALIGNYGSVGNTQNYDCLPPIIFNLRHSLELLLKIMPERSPEQIQP